jgi:hypothetical protein
MNDTVEVNVKRLANIEATQEKLHSSIIESNKEARGYVDQQLKRVDLNPISQRLATAEDIIKQFSKDFIESHDDLGARIHGHTEALTKLHVRLESTEGRSDLVKGFTDKLHNRLELVESRPENEERFGVIHHQIERMEALIKESLQPETPDLSEIYTALAAAQLEIQNAEANIQNEFLDKRYADLASTLNAVREPLAKNGIALFQQTADPGQGVLGIKTTLAHTSGQTLEDLITMSPPKNDPQGIGSCRTYMRRYAVLAMCGIAGALDDDAERTKIDPDDYPRINTGEVEKIIYHADELFGEHADDAVKLMLDRVFSAQGKITVVGDIREGEMQTALTYLDNAKKARDKREAKAKANEKVAAKAAAEKK